MDENQKYEIIKKLVDTNGNKKTAALKIGCSDRHINRLIKGYQEKGKAFFIHGNRGRQPAITLPTDTKQLILDLYRTKYSTAILTHYSELLAEKENIKVSVSTITSILRKEYILSPKANRSTKKAVKKELKALQSKTKSKKKVAIIQSSILDLEDSHPRRPDVPISVKCCKWMLLYTLGLEIPKHSFISLLMMPLGISLALTLMNKKP